MPWNAAFYLPSSTSGFTTAPILSRVRWSRRGYDITALENVYTGDQARVSLIIQAIQDKVADPIGDACVGLLCERCTRAVHGTRVLSPWPPRASRIGGHAC